MKSTTDLHWSARARSVEDDLEVNIMDVFQRELEYEYIARYLRPNMNLLEVGCGNGFSTNRFRPLVQHVDAFDYSEEMIARARATYGETNNRFFHDNVLEPKSVAAAYDAVLCVRVLINLRSIGEQRQAIASIARLVRPEGMLILAEGYQEGFTALSALRQELGLPPVEPAAINVYATLDQIRPIFTAEFALEDEFHLGMYDYLTRVVYPLVAGPDNVRHNTVFSEKCFQLARAFNPDAVKHLSRMRGLVLRKRA